MSVQNFVNGINSFTQTAGAVQGATEAMVPAVYAVDNAINQVAGVFTGDTYQQPGYYPPTQTFSDPNAVKMGLVGGLLSGGVSGAMMHNQMGNAFRSFKAGFGIGIKNLGISSLKAGAVGGVVSGIVSGVKNMAAYQRGEIAKADAGGNIAADTIGGLLAGTSGGISAGLANMVLGRFGLTGIPLTIGAAVVGALGGAGASALYESSGVRDSVAGSMRKAFGGADPQGYASGYATQSYAPQGYYGY